MGLVWQNGTKWLVNPHWYSNFSSSGSAGSRAPDAEMMKAEYSRKILRSKSNADINSFFFSFIFQIDRTRYHTDTCFTRPTTDALPTCKRRRHFNCQVVSLAHTMNEKAFPDFFFAKLKHSFLVCKHGRLLYESFHFRPGLGRPIG